MLGLFFVVLILEFTAYRLLLPPFPSRSTYISTAAAAEKIFSSRSSIKTDYDGSDGKIPTKKQGVRRHATSATDSHHHRHHDANPIPSQQPTIVTAAAAAAAAAAAHDNHSSLEPTSTPKGRRLESAISQHYRNAQYWKTHTPDPVMMPTLLVESSPLDTSTARNTTATTYTSPDDNNNTVDAKKAEEEREQPRTLPPIIAYVVTLTKCVHPSKGRGSLDGAAVLLHSIRRNSYGWDPSALLQRRGQQQQQQQDTQAKEDVPHYGGNGGRYRYRAYVIVDPSASPHNEGTSGECARFLQKIGYTVLHRAPLVPLFELTEEEEDGDAEEEDYGGGSSSSSSSKNGTTTGGHGFYSELKALGYVGKQRPHHGPTARSPNENPNKLRLLMHNDGCCGYAELLKLHVYGLVEHELAVHLDFDSLLLRPMDDLFDVMLGKGDVESRMKKIMESNMMANLPRTKDVDYSKPIDAAFTRDYNSVVKPRLDAPVGYQGGFLVVRPDLQVLERYRSILQKGEFLLNPRRGWGGKHGGFYGDLTFQGILPYYYEDVAPQWEAEDEEEKEVGHNEIELNRCIYNQMADNPRKSTYKFPRATPLDPKAMGFRDTNICRDGRKDCSDTDCQRTHPKDSITAHFTFSGKPWDCSVGNAGTVAHDTCIGLLREWFSIRRELENWWWLFSSSSANNSRPCYWKEETVAKVLKSRQGALNTGTPYLGYCDEYGSGGYRRLVEPDEAI